MTYKQIEASRERRLWATQIVIPAIALLTTTLVIPEVRQSIGEGFTKAKNKIKNKFKRKES